MQSSRSTMKSSRKIQPKQIRQIWAMSRNIGLTEEFIYELVAMETKSMTPSISKMTADQADRVIRSLYKLQSQDQKRISREKRLSRAEDHTVHRLPTKDQIELAEKIRDEINTTIARTIDLDALAQKTWKKDFKLLNYHEMQGFIEALKSMRNRYRSFK